jgi:hypothetical protein
MAELQSMKFIVCGMFTKLFTIIKTKEKTKVQGVFSGVPFRTPTVRTQRNIGYMARTL